MQVLDNLYKNEAFVINAVTYSSSNADSTNTAEVFLLFKEHATLRDVLRGQVHAFLVRRQLHQQGYTSAETILPMYNLKKSQLSRMQNVGVLKSIQGQLTERESDCNAVRSEVVDGLITKLLEDKDWNISIAMLEPRFARLCCTRYFVVFVNFCSSCKNTYRIHLIYHPLIRTKLWGCIRYLWSLNRSVSLPFSYKFESLYMVIVWCEHVEEEN